MSAGAKVAKTSRDPSAVTSAVRDALRAGSESRYEAWFREVQPSRRHFCVTHTWSRHGYIAESLRRVAIGDNNAQTNGATRLHQSARGRSAIHSKTERAERESALRQGWEDSDLSKRDRSLITVAALVCLRRMDEFPAHLHRAIGNGVTETELAAAITHLAFYAGFPAAISASAVANGTLRQSPK